MGLEGAAPRLLRTLGLAAYGALAASRGAVGVAGSAPSLLTAPSPSLLTAPSRSPEAPQFRGGSAPRGPATRLLVAEPPGTVHVTDARDEYRVFRDGYCSTFSAWTPGNHGCAYVATREECSRAAASLGLGGGADVSAFDPERRTLVMSFPRGCLAGASSKDAVRFARGDGTAQCSKEAPCVCRCPAGAASRNPEPAEEISARAVLRLVAAAVFLGVSLGGQLVGVPEGLGQQSASAQGLNSALIGA